jgi:Domain of unknown function (DUF4153)
MTEPSTATAPSQSARIDDLDPPWRARPAIMALLCAVAGVIFYHLVDGKASEPLAAFVGVATILFVMTAEQRRLTWAAGFALLWAAVIALIVQNNRGYSVNGSPFEWPFWSGLLAVAVAAPLFQTWRDAAVSLRDWRWWQLPYERLHRHAWTDAVIGAAGGAFVGISMALAALIAAMFNLIGIDALSKLMQEGWFIMGLAGAAFGGANGLLRERDKLVGNLQRLVMVVLGVLAPVLAVALALFLLALIGTGLQVLWDSGFSTAALMLGASAFAVLLANAVMGNGAEDRAANPLLRWAAPVLAVAVLPLAAIALYSMLMRIGQYGWTPERLWGMVAVLVALGYGLAGAWSLALGRRDFDDLLRPLQQKLAIGLMLLATFLALPIVDFGAISTRDQLARLASKQVKPEDFDWAALAYDFGPNGRAALARLKKSPDETIAESAKVALASKDRWALTRGEDAGALRPIEKMVRVVPADRPLTPAIYAALQGVSQCLREPCVARWMADDRIAVLARYSKDANFELHWLIYDAHAKRWNANYAGQPIARAFEAEKTVDVTRGNVTTRKVTLEQMVVDGVPVGPVYDPAAPALIP